MLSSSFGGGPETLPVGTPLEIISWEFEIQVSGFDE